MGIQRCTVEPFKHLLQRHRARQVIALNRVTAKTLEHIQSGAILDTLGYHLDVQRVAQFDGGADNGLVGAVIGQAADEGPVDLEQIDRQPLQILQ